MRRKVLGLQEAVQVYAWPSRAQVIHSSGVAVNYCPYRLTTGEAQIWKSMKGFCTPLRLIQGFRSNWVQHLLKYGLMRDCDQYIHLVFSNT
ncbi:hypothetical protein Q8A67_011104 [Cirrhinus molitorella]|uniref:Uncharacterized protein n=1 Tax=Cirrhinus molitorella TaxID=172907 RepID=A0AA88TN29_9TELE|nr:hypothetical protein Q8A67_011104 [Cirrhinus molitorella]